MFNKKNINFATLFLLGCVLIFFYFLYVLINSFFNSSNYAIKSTEFFRDIESVEIFGEKLSFNNTDNFYLKRRIDREFHVITDTLYQYALWLKRSSLYLPYIEKRLQEEGLPDDIKYLPIAESYLRYKALSRVGASGIWQFTPSTARQYGLVVNDYVDERDNYKKATNAAIKHLKGLNNDFDGDWFLTLAAYNRGASGVKSVQEIQGKENYFDLWLNSETRRFVSKIIAVKIAYENYEKLGMKLYQEDFYERPEYSIDKVSSIDDIYNYISKKGMGVYEFKRLNPWIKLEKNKLPKRKDGKMWKIKLKE